MGFCLNHAWHSQEFSILFYFILVVHPRLSLKHLWNPTIDVENDVIGQQIKETAAQIATPQSHASLPQEVTF